MLEQPDQLSGLAGADRRRPRLHAGERLGIGVSPGDTRHSGSAPAGEPGWSSRAALRRSSPSRIDWLENEGKRDGHSVDYPSWNETAEFVRREAGLLLPVSFMLLALPNALMELLIPPPPMPGQAPEAGLWLLLVPLSWPASSAMSRSPISRSGRGARSARRCAAARRGMPALLGAAILLGIAFVVLSFIVAPRRHAGARRDDRRPGRRRRAAMLRGILYVMLIIVPGRDLFRRLMMVMTPHGGGGSGGPSPDRPQLGPYRRSRLEAGRLPAADGHSRRNPDRGDRGGGGILFALLAGPIEPGSTSTLLVVIVMTLVNMVVGAYLASFVARIYAQLSGGHAEGVRLTAWSLGAAGRPALEGRSRRASALDRASIPVNLHRQPPKMAGARAAPRRT